MILLADSGSTSTDWRLIDASGQITSFKCEGMNPFIVDEPTMTEVIAKTFAATDRERVAEVHFYGAGCISEAAIGRTTRAIVSSFPKANVVVDTDLLGAARAACGKERGIAAILGTGTACCLFDGAQLEASTPSLGYVLGDEGSGNHIGKQVVKAYFHGQLSEQLATNFERRFNLTREELLEAVYRGERPNRYLASFSKFVFQNLKHPEMVQLVYGCFSEFFDVHVLPLHQKEPLQLHVVGSVGFYYGDILRKCAADHGVSLGRVLETPIAGLTMFHHSME